MTKPAPKTKTAKPSKQVPTAEPKTDPHVLQVVRGLEGIDEPMNTSQIAARLATRSYLTSHAMRAYAGFSKDLMTVSDVDHELRANGDALVAGDLGRLERMLIGQAITLDTIFANLAERSSRQEYVKNMETFLRLAMKAQAQCRATAETLALIKNPMPYIRQANIAQGHQQVNNGVAEHCAHTATTSFEQTKILEQHHGEWLDTGAQGATSRANPQLGALEAEHRPKD